MSQPSREHFLDHVVTHVKTKFPLVEIDKAKEQDFAVTVNGNVASLENLYRIILLQPERVDRHIDRWMVELLRASEGSPDQSAAFTDVKDRIMPMILAEKAIDHEGAMVSQSFLPGLRVAYALDNDRTIAYIPQVVFNSWGITLEELHQTALDNLISRSREIGGQAAQDEDGTINLVILQTLDGYDASRILLPSLHERLKRFLGTPFAAGIPNRDILLCFRNDEEMADRLKKQIGSDYKEMPHQISDRVLLVTADGIAYRD
jgi:uncharacterized protein YtpQ (UPF0354 family)